MRYRKKLTILWPKFKKTLDIREKQTNEGNIQIELTVSQQPKALEN